MLPTSSEKTSSVPGYLQVTHDLPSWYIFEHVSNWAKTTQGFFRQPDTTKHQAPWWPWKHKPSKTYLDLLLCSSQARRLSGGSNGLGLSSSQLRLLRRSDHKLSQYCMNYIIRAHCRWPRTAYPYRCLALFSSCVPVKCGVGGIIKEEEQDAKTNLYADVTVSKALFFLRQKLAILPRLA